MDKLAFSIGDTLFSGASSKVYKEVTGISGIISLFLKIAFVLAGLTLLFFFIMGGIGMISGAGQSNPQKAEQSKKTITSAIIGFVIVFTSYWIVKLIGQLLGINNLI